MHGANGEILKWFGTCTDIEELKRAETLLPEANALLEQRVDERTAALRESEERHRMLAETMLQGVVPPGCQWHHCRDEPRRGADPR